MAPSFKKSSPASYATKKKLRQRNHQRNQAIRVIAILSVAAALIFLVVSTTSDKESETSRPVEGVQSFPNLERDHTDEPVAYEQDPPVGGPHNPAWQNCGVYSELIVDENAVHTLEHGAVWINYQPSLPAADIQKLQTLTRQSGYRLLSPDPELASPIVLSAWGYQLELEQVDDPRLTAFIEKYELNPQSPEPGAPCTGGIGQPG